MLALGCSGPRLADAPPQVTISVNGTQGGKNRAEVAWLQTMAPRISEKLGVPVQVVTDGGSDESFKAKLILDLYSGQGADVVTFDGFWTAGMASAGLVAPLDDRLRAWPRWSDYLASQQAMGAFGGHTYAVPFYTDVRGLYYRRDLFARAGLPDPWRPRSWEDILEAGEALKQLEGVTPIQWNAGTSFGEATTMQGLYLPLLSAGGRLYQDGGWVVTGAPLRQALEFYREIYQVRELGDVRLQLDPKGRERSFEQFRDGRIGIYPEGTYLWLGVIRPGATWGMPERDRLVGWAPMPGMTEALPPVSISGGGGFIVNKNSPHPELAWQALQMMAGLDSLTVRLELDPFIPCRRDALESQAFQRVSDPVIRQQVDEGLPVTTFRPGLPAYPRISELAQQMVEKVATGVPIEEAMADYATGVTRLVGRENVR